MLTGLRYAIASVHPKTQDFDAAKFLGNFASSNFCEKDRRTLK
jgi:hypothetical protein